VLRSVGTRHDLLVELLAALMKNIVLKTAMERSFEIVHHSLRNRIGETKPSGLVPEKH
jgi:hypothetical protein